VGVHPPLEATRAAGRGCWKTLVPWSASCSHWSPCRRRDHDDPLWDGIGTLSIGALLVIIAITLAVEMKGLLIGEAASLTDQQKIAAAIEIEPSVTRLIHMRTQHLGPDELLVGAKLELAHGLSVDDAAEAVNRIEASVRRAVPSARVIYLEPDVFRTSLPSDDVAPVVAESAPVDTGRPD